MTRFSTFRATAATALGAAMFAGPALPAQERSDVRPASATGAGTQGQSDDTGRKYCVESKVTGTRFAKRICRTEAQWRERGVDIHAATRSSDQSSQSRNR